MTDSKYKYLVLNDKGEVVYTYSSLEDAITKAFNHDGWSISRQRNEGK